MGRAEVTFWLIWLRRLVVGIGTLYVGVLAVLGGTQLARPAFTICTAAWITGLSVVIFRQARRGNDAAAISSGLRARSMRIGEILLTNCIAALVLAEIGLQTMIGLGAAGELARADLDAFRLVPGTDYGAGLRANSRGYPGADLDPQKTPGKVRIVALGDSFAIGPAVAYGDNYLTRTAHEIANLEMANLGLSGAGPREYWQVLETDGWRLDPDLVLVSIFIGNDITEALGRPRGLDARRHAVTLLCLRSWKLAQEAGRGGNVFNSGGGDRLSAEPLSEKTFREVEARRLLVCQKQAPPSLEKRWHLALAALDGLAASCRRHKVPLAAVLIPDEFQVNPAVQKQAIADAGLSPPDLDFAGPQRRLSAFFAERGVPCLDLLAALGNRSDCYAVRDTHWNAAGNRAASQALIEWIPTILSARP